MSTFLGIDFGSSTCRTVLLRDAALEVVRNRFDERGLPPAMLAIQSSSMDSGFGDKGFPAVFRSLKQELGSLQPLKTAVGIHDVAAKISEILSRVREDLCGTISEPIGGVVLGIPGFFTDSPRAALRDAAHRAGFPAVRFIDEGLAAILGTSRQMDRGTILVYGLGSGVFSATVVVLENGRPRVVSAEGNRLLGGSYLDIALASLILERLGLGGDFASSLASAIYLKKLSEQVKIGLSRREEELFDVNLTELFGTGGVTPLVVRRSEFEEAISAPVDLAFELTKKAIEGAGVSPASLDLIVMVGDSTRIPLIESRLATEYDTQMVRAGNTDVARGAALFGGQIGEAHWKRPEASSPVLALPVPVVSPRPAPRAQEPGTWPAKFSPKLLEAELKWKAGDGMGAINAFEGIVKEAHEFLGTLYHSEGQGFLRDGKYDEAVDVLGKAVRFTHESDNLDRVKKDYHRSLNHRAVQLLQNGRMEEARITVRKALDIVPNCKGCAQLSARIDQALRVAARGMNRKKR